MGHRLRRTIDMFSSTRNLVEENDHRLEMMDRDESCEFSPEYALLPLQQVDIHKFFTFYRADAIQCAYNELIKQVPLVITLVDHGDAEALAALY
jgi:hypothetical protein